MKLNNYWNQFLDKYDWMKQNFENICFLLVYDCLITLFVKFNYFVGNSIWVLKTLLTHRAYTTLKRRGNDYFQHLTLIESLHDTAGSVEKKATGFNSGKIYLRILCLLGSLFSQHFPLSCFIEKPFGFSFTWNSRFIG